MYYSNRPDGVCCSCSVRGGSGSGRILLGLLSAGGNRPLVIITLLLLYSSFQNVVIVEGGAASTGCENMDASQLERRLRDEGDFDQRYMASNLDQAAGHFADLADARFIQKAELYTCDSECAQKTQEIRSVFAKYGQIPSTASIPDFNIGPSFADIRQLLEGRLTQPQPQVQVQAQPQQQWNGGDLFSEMGPLNAPPPPPPVPAVGQQQAPPPPPTSNVAQAVVANQQQQQAQFPAPPPPPPPPLPAPTPSPEPASLPAPAPAPAPAPGPAPAPAPAPGPAPEPVPAPAPGPAPEPAPAPASIPVPPIAPIAGGGATNAPAPIPGPQTPPDVPPPPGPVTNNNNNAPDQQPGVVSAQPQPPPPPVAPTTQPTVTRIVTVMQGEDVIIQEEGAPPHNEGTVRWLTPGDLTRSARSSDDYHHYKRVRDRRGAPPANTTRIGQTMKLHCSKKGAEEQQGLHILCGSCRVIRELPAEYFPRYINEISCAGSTCFDKSTTGGGRCVEQLLSFSILRNIGTSNCHKWVPYSISVPVCCSCLMSDQLAQYLMLPWKDQTLTTRRYRGGGG